MKKIAWIILFSVLQMNLCRVAVAKSHSFDDLAILVVSCDKYSELWDNFFNLMYKNWPSLKDSESNVPIYLIANSKKFSDSRVQTIQIPNEISWSDNVLKALDPNAK